MQRRHLTTDVICTLGARGHATAGDTGRNTRVLRIAIVFCVVMMVIEAVGGVVAHSLAVLSDAVHMLADVFALSISLFAAHASTWSASDTFSFGWRRAEVVGALGSVFTTWALVVWISLSALERSVDIVRCASDTNRDGCEVLETPLMLSLGLFGFAMNIVLALILHCGGVHAHSHGGLSGHTHSHDHHSHDHGHGHGHDNHSLLDGHHHDHATVGVVTVTTILPPTVEHAALLSSGADVQTSREVTTSSAAVEAEVSAPEKSIILSKSAAQLSESESPCTCHHDGEADGVCHGRTQTHGSPTHRFSEAHTGHGSEAGDDDDDGGDDDAHAHGSMNVRAALLHVIGDCLQALGVVVAAGVMWAGNVVVHGVSSTAHSYWNLADPMLSLLFGVVTVFTTKRLIKDVMEILMERVPPSVVYNEVVDQLQRVPQVQAVEDLHIWAVGPDFSVLCAKVAVPLSLTTQEAQQVTAELTRRCQASGVQHVTVELSFS